MSFPMSTWLWGPALTMFAVLIVSKTLSRQNAAQHLPPGPKALPIIGNALDVPRKDLGREWLAVSKKHGDVVYLNVLGQHMIVLGSLKAANDLLDKRSAKYSDRPTSVMAELVGFPDWLFVLMNYGPEWRRHRRTFHQLMNFEVLKSYEPIQSKVARNLVRNIRQTPQDIGLHLEFAFAAIVMRAIYGIELLETNKKYFNMVKRVAEVGEDILVPGRYVVEIIPWLRCLPRWFPGAGFKRFAANANYDIRAIVEELFNTAKDAMGSGVVKDSGVTRLLSLENVHSYEKQTADEIYEMCKGVMATTYIAGADTSHSSMRGFFLAMALYPEVQKKAQAEIDTVVGSGRFPDFSDRQALPYTNALLKELLRWHVVTPIGVPHRTAAADEYNGCIIPGDAIIFANIWAISRDPSVYPEPEKFLPERFLDENGRLNCEGKDPADFAFGFGRRICPGRHFADATLFIVCATVLWAFDIKPPVDEKGRTKPISHDIKMSSVVAHVVASEYTIEVRSPHRDRDRLILETS